LPGDAHPIFEAVAPGTGLLPDFVCIADHAAVRAAPAGGISWAVGCA
jgi:hypothetical protein